MDKGRVLIEKQFFDTKSDEYICTVFVYENAIACTCKVAAKKQICKHMMRVASDIPRVIYNATPYFYEKLKYAIDIKKNKELPYKIKIREYAKVVYYGPELKSVPIRRYIT